MTPAARVAAAIDVLDAVIAGAAAEQALTSWARGSRFAGSKDRAAVRDHVYDVLRRMASLRAAAGQDGGRALMIAMAKQQAWDLDVLFGGEGYGAAALTDDEKQPLLAVADVWDQVDIPQWLWPAWSDSLGEQAQSAALAQQDRAHVFLRINSRATTVPLAIAALAAEDITAIAHQSVSTCLQVTGNPRRIKISRAYQDGLVEVQDAASQAAMLRIKVAEGDTVLDYCAGGGGKSLAIAALHNCRVTAHDIAFDRMQDIEPRSERAGVIVTKARTSDLKSPGAFDVVLCDAPCSGSGTWRRTPDAKWRLDQGRLNSYNVLQAEVLVKSATFVRPGGQLAYMTCSVLDCENDEIVRAFLSGSPSWVTTEVMTLAPGNEWDGFYLNVLQRDE